MQWKNNKKCMCEHDIGNMDEIKNIKKRKKWKI